MKRDNSNFYQMIKRCFIGITIFLLSSLFFMTSAHASWWSSLGSTYDFNWIRDLKNDLRPIFDWVASGEASAEIKETRDDWSCIKVYGTTWNPLPCLGDPTSDRKNIELNADLMSLLENLGQAMYSGDFSKVLDSKNSEFMSAVINKEGTAFSNAKQQQIIRTFASMLPKNQKMLIPVGNNVSTLMLPGVFRYYTPSPFAHIDGNQSIESTASAVDIQFIGDKVVPVYGVDVPLTGNIRFGMVLDNHTINDNIQYDWQIGQNKYTKFTVSSAFGIGHNLSTLGGILGVEVVANLTCDERFICMTTQIRVGALLDVDVPKALNEAQFNPKAKWILKNWFGKSDADALALSNAAKQAKFSWANWKPIFEGPNLVSKESGFQKLVNLLSAIVTTVISGYKDGATPSSIVQYVQDAAQFICGFIDQNNVACGVQQISVTSVSGIFLNDTWAKDPTKPIIQGWRHSGSTADQVSFHTTWQPTITFGRGVGTVSNHLILRARLMASLTNAYIIPLTHAGTLRYTSGAYFGS